MRQNSQHQPKPKPGGKHQFLQFWDHLKTGDRDREGRGKKEQSVGPQKRRLLCSGLAGVRKMMNFALIKSWLICLFEVCEHWTEQTRVPADMI